MCGHPAFRSIVNFSDGVLLHKEASLKRGGSSVNMWIKGKIFGIELGVTLFRKVAIVGSLWGP